MGSLLFRSPSRDEDKKEATAEVDAKEMGKAMNGFLEGLSRESRVIFLRRYWFCDTVGEIAARFGIRESRVKKLLSRTRSALEAYLEKEAGAV